MRHAVRGVERRRGHRLEDQTRARRDEAIEALEVLRVPVVVEAHRERVDAEAGDRLPVVGERRSGPARRGRRRRRGRGCRRPSRTGGRRRPSRAPAARPARAWSSRWRRSSRCCAGCPCSGARAPRRRAACGVARPGRERARDVGLVEQRSCGRSRCCSPAGSPACRWNRPRRRRRSGRTCRSGRRACDCAARRRGRAAGRRPSRRHRRSRASGSRPDRRRRSRSASRREDRGRTGCRGRRCDRRGSARSRSARPCRRRRGWSPWERCPGG